MNATALGSSRIIVFEAVSGDEKAASSVGASESIDVIVNRPYFSSAFYVCSNEMHEGLPKRLSDFG